MARERRTYTDDFKKKIVELYKKWNRRPVSNWAMVRNQLTMDDKNQERILK